MSRRKSAAQKRQQANPTWARRRAVTLQGRPAVSSEDTDHLARYAADVDEVQR